MFLQNDGRILAGGENEDKTTSPPSQALATPIPPESSHRPMYGRWAIPENATASAGLLLRHK